MKPNVTNNHFPIDTAFINRKAEEKHSVFVRNILSIKNTFLKCIEFINLKRKLIGFKMEISKSEKEAKLNEIYKNTKYKSYKLYIICLESL